MLYEWVAPPTDEEQGSISVNVASKVGAWTNVERKEKEEQSSRIFTTGKCDHGHKGSLWRIIKHNYPKILDCA